MRIAVVLPSDHTAAAVVLWIAATHAVPAWNTAPRLVIKAPEKRCGKSRLLDLIEALCHQPILTANASPSAVYRSIGAAPGRPAHPADRRSRHHLRTQGRRRPRRPPRPAQRRPPTRPARPPLGRRQPTARHDRHLRHGRPRRHRRHARHHRRPRRHHRHAPPRTRRDRPALPDPPRWSSPAPTSRPTCTAGSAATSTSSKPPHPTCPSKTAPPTPGNPSSRSPTPPAATGPPTPAPPSSPSPTDDVDVDNVSLRVRLLIDCRTAFGDADGLPIRDPASPGSAPTPKRRGTPSARTGSPPSRWPRCSATSASTRPTDAGRTAAKPRAIDASSSTTPGAATAPTAVPGHLSVPAVPAVP